MPVRVTIEGTQFECDTIDEAVEIHTRLHGSPRPKPRQVRRTKRSSGKPTDLLAEGGAVFFEALKSSPEGILSEDLAKKLGMSTKSLPPLVLGMRRRAQRLGLDLDSYVVRQREYVRGRPVSRYKLTEEGTKTFS